MRIVDVCAFYTPLGGGVRTYVRHKLAAAARAGLDMVILAPGAHHGQTRVNGGIIATIPAPKLPVDRRYRYFASESALHAVLGRWRPDVVEASSPWASAAMVARWQGSARRALVMHADPMSAYAYRWFGGFASLDTIDQRFGRFWRHLRDVSAGMDMVVSASRDLSRRLADRGVARIETIPMGVEPGVFSPSLRDEALRARLLSQCGLPPTATLLLGVGRYSTEKRWPMVIESVMAAGRSTPCGLLLIGEGRNRRSLETCAAGSPHVIVGGPVLSRTSLASIMASADALVHGCEAETFCMVGAEAVASGLPVIAPARGGAADHVRPGAGRHFRAADADSLRRAIEGFILDRSGGAVMPTGPVRTMDEHFDELFAKYALLQPQLRVAA